jgi:hypothetical protein
MSRPSASELREALRAGLVERLAPAGWRLVGDEGDRRVALVCPVADEFVATIDVWQASSSPDRPPVIVTFMHAGVGYEPLRRLAPLLGMFGLAVESATVWPEAFAQDEDEDDDHDWDDEGDDEIEEAEEQDEDAEDEDDEWHGRELRTVAEADRLAGELAAVALERAVPYARRYADVDRLLASVPGPRSGTIRRAALLAAAGRFDEAKVSLAQVPPPAPGLEWMRDEQRAARQLQRWIESGGDPALIPETPLPPRYATSRSPSMSQLWRESRAASAAVDAVRRDGEGKDRSQ